MEQDDIVRSLITSVGNFIEDRLADKDQRFEQKEQCAERLAAEEGAPNHDKEVCYSDQAVLANLDWGIDALEEAINTSTAETKMARLDYAEKMLQVCAMLNSSQKTAGVPNFYLSAWAHLNLSYLHVLRNDFHKAVVHVLEMFIVDPFFSRIDFAPELWKCIFLPQMSSIVRWYSEERRMIMIDMIPDTSDLSVTVDFDQYFNESLILSVRPEQAERIQHLEQVYGQSLDENTRLYAKYYKDYMFYDSTTSRKVMPMLPIAEPPLTPLHEVGGCSIPDYVKFGPILPKSAGFSPVLKFKDDAGDDDASRSMGMLSSQNLEDFADWNALEEVPGDDRDLPNSHEILSNSLQAQLEDDTRSIASSRSTRQKKEEAASSGQGVQITGCSQKSSPKLATCSRKTKLSMLRLLSTRAMDSPLPYCDSSSTGSNDSDGELAAQLKTARKTVHCSGQVFPKRNVVDDGCPSFTSSPTSNVLTPQSRPPKDFVCAITGQLFNDPVTLETGQTYERKAIQEWMNRGNTTCPITRQPLSAASLPKTNYVLKRLITSWKEQHPDLAHEFSFTDTPRNHLTNNSLNETSIHYEADHKSQQFRQAGVAMATSPPNEISQASVETLINVLNPHILCLCSSDDLKECEAAVLKIIKIWKDSNVYSGIYTYLSSPTIVNGLMEILSASLNKDVLRATIYILSKMISVDDHVGNLVTSIDSNFCCFIDLLKGGLVEASILLFLLGPSYSHLSSQHLIATLIVIISSKNEDPVDDLHYPIAPKDAAIALLEQIVVDGDEDDTSRVIEENGVPTLLNCLDRNDGRQSIVSILLCCIRFDIKCRNLVASRIELSPVLELFHVGNDGVKGICIEFLCELVQLNRRTLSNRILQVIRDEGTFSTMHNLLVYLQASTMKQKPAVATLLLQLDLLAAPRKMSIYREEAMDALIEPLQRKDFPLSQIMSLNALSSLSGHVNSSKRQELESWLLKLAGFNQLVMRRIVTESTETKEEEKAARIWETRVAFVLSNHEKGMIFKALEECFKSNSIETARSCLVVATWLVHMLYTFPDCGARVVALKLLLDKFINVLQSSKNLEEKILATLALRSFVNEPGGVNEISKHAKSIWQTLRRLKKCCTVAHNVMKSLIKSHSLDAAELWSCAEGPEVDVSINGEILSLVHVKNWLISGHSDGTMKMWDTGKRVPRLIQESREHSKAVTCLCVLPSRDKLCSGSLDKTIRVWSIKHDEIRCIQVHDVKEAIYVLAANSNMACFSSQGYNVKVYNWSGIPKCINFNKQVKCMALDNDKLYCGCSSYSIQEVDLRTQTSSTFYSGTKKLLTKHTINSVEIHNNVLYVCGSSIDGIAGKVFNLSSKAIVGSLGSGVEIQQMRVCSDMIFLATRYGEIQVLVRENLANFGSVKIASGRTTAVTCDEDGQKLFAATSDAKLQVWSME